MLPPASSHALAEKPSIFENWSSGAPASSASNPAATDSSTSAASRVVSDGSSTLSTTHAPSSRKAATARKAAAVDAERNSRAAKLCTRRSVHQRKVHMRRLSSWSCVANRTACSGCSRPARWKRRTDASGTTKRMKKRRAMTALGESNDDADSHMILSCACGLQRVAARGDYDCPTEAGRGASSTQANRFKTSDFGTSVF